MDYIYQLLDLLKRWSSYLGLTSNKNLEDNFYQLLHDKNYDEALKLAQHNKYLDIDLVYKCKWRNSGITVQSINNVLGKIQDKLWAINECVQTVPISYEACRTLLEFGLKEANLRLLYHLGDEVTPKKSRKNTEQSGNDEDKKLRQKTKDKPKLKLADDISDGEIEGQIDFESLTDQQNELCRCRQDLLRHEHSLFAYESILGDYRSVQRHFDHVFYDEFRQKSPLSACIDYAHDGDAHAVEIMLNFYSDDLVPHLLPILSEFPETQSPFQYRNLLPCLREGDTVFERRAISGRIKQEEFDWSKRSQDLSFNSSFSSSLSVEEKSEIFEKEFYESNLSLKKYANVPLTHDILTNWFIERALEMESKTLLLSSGIQLLHLGFELNIKNLNETHDDLVEFDRIIYDCCGGDDIYLSFKDFNKMETIDRLIFITGNSAKNCKDRFRFYVIPYINRREPKFEKKTNFSSQRDIIDKAEILRIYFRKLAHNGEKICRLIYNDLLDKIECDNFVAEWTQDLDDVIDEIGVEIESIERSREAEQLSTVASQTLSLGDLNGCYEACKLIMKQKHKDSWALCCQLGMHKQFNNNGAKYKLLAFALAHCEDSDGKMSAKILNFIIELRKRDEKIQLAYLHGNL